MKTEVKEWKEKYKSMDSMMRQKRNMSEETSKEIIGTHYQMQSLKSQMAILNRGGGLAVKKTLVTQRYNDGTNSSKMNPLFTASIDSNIRD
jgi:hypothetical protein